MTDLSVVPWSWCWAGCVLAVSGMVLALHGIGQRNPSRIANIGGIIVTIGCAVLLTPPLVNGGLMLLSAFHGVALEAVAATRPGVPDADR